MDYMRRVDPELAAVLQALPTESLIDWDDLRASREVLAQTLATTTDSIADSENVVKEDRTVPGSAGAPDLLVRTYRPVNGPGTLPGLFWVHGGGYVLGDIEQDDIVVQHFVEEVGCVAVSVGYRLAPEHPFPAPLEDCYAALKWMAHHAAELGVDPTRIAVGGASAGGGLAAGLVLLARDRSELAVAFQLLVSPMIDDRNTTPSSREFTDTRVWSRRDNLNGWRAYLGSDPGGGDVSPYAAASRATDLAGLPPAYVVVGSLDVFLDEDIDYAQRLLQTGIPTELHVYQGAFHGWDALAPTAAISRRYVAERDLVLKRALHPEPRPSSG